MRKHLIKALTFCLLALFVAGSTLPVLAQEKEKQEKKAASPDRKMPFYGKIAEIDKTAKTVKIGTRTFHFTESTEIIKEGKKATLGDAKIGEIAGGSFQDKGGKLELVKIRFGEKTEDEGKTLKNEKAEKSDKKK